MVHRLTAAASFLQLASASEGKVDGIKWFVKNKLKKGVKKYWNLQEINNVLKIKNLWVSRK